MEEESKTIVTEKTTVRAKDNKLTLAALLLSVLSLGTAGAAFFWVSENTVSQQSFEEYQTSVPLSAAQAAEGSVEVLRTDLESLKSDISLLRQEFESTKQNPAPGREEISEEIDSKIQTIQMKLSALEDAVKRAPKSPSAPVTKPQLAPTTKPKKGTPLPASKTPTRNKPIRR